MNRKTLYLNVLAAALLSSAGAAAYADESEPLAEAIRLQMHDARANIQADTRASLVAQARRLDVAGVEAGPVELVEGEVATNDRTQASLSHVGPVDLLREELALKALENPGLFGVYRYMSEQALGMAIVVVE